MSALTANIGSAGQTITVVEPLADSSLSTLATSILALRERTNGLLTARIAELKESAEAIEEFIEDSSDDDAADPPTKRKK